MVELVKKYIENRIELVKLELISSISNVAAGLINSFLIMVVGLFVVLMLSFSLAFWLSSIFEDHAIGFLIVGGIYILIFLSYLLISKDKIELKVKDKIVREMMSSGEEINEYDEYTEK